MTELMFWIVIDIALVGMLICSIVQAVLAVREFCDARKKII
jgi:hypothetical protein